MCDILFFDPVLQNGPSLRPRHLHVSLSADGFESLFTQLYWADDPYLGDCCNSDNPMLWMSVDEETGKGEFNFVLKRAQGI